MKPGEIIPADGPFRGNPGKRTVELDVTNTLDRAVQVTSHYHVFEANRALVFDREQAYGMRLDVPAGFSVRFDPGETKRVRLVELGGARVVTGFHRLVEGALDDAGVREAALARAREQGFIR